METVINLETLRDSLPHRTISDYSAKERVLDAIDIKLERNDKPHMIADTSFNQLVEITKKQIPYQQLNRTLWNLEQAQQCSIKCCSSNP